MKNDLIHGYKVPHFKNGTSLHGRYVERQGEILVWKLASGEIQQRIAMQERSLFCLALSPSGLSLATGFHPQQAAIFSVRSP